MPQCSQWTTRGKLQQEGSSYQGRLADNHKLHHCSNCNGYRNIFNRHWFQKLSVQEGWNPGWRWCSIWLWLLPLCVCNWNHVLCNAADWLEFSPYYEEVDYWCRLDECLGQNSEWMGGYLCLHMDAGSSNSMEEQTSSCIYIERSMIDFNFQHSSPVDIQKAERSTYLEI